MPQLPVFRLPVPALAQEPGQVPVQELVQPEPELVRVPVRLPEQALLLMLNLLQKQFR